jgi:hypothetical protein
MVVMCLDLKGFLMVAKFQPLLLRFLAKIKIKPETGCWEWTAGKYRDGYGAFGVGGRAGGNKRAHRVSYELHRGPIPGGMLVCHRCDNRICVNPEHLFLGTSADNLADMTIKGRRARVGHPGASNPSAKLTAEDAIAIRDAVDVPIDALMKRYDIGRSVVFGIRAGRLWAHLPRSKDAGDLLDGSSTKVSNQHSAESVRHHPLEGNG